MLTLRIRLRPRFAPYPSVPLQCLGDFGGFIDRPSLEERRSFGKIHVKRQGVSQCPKITRNIHRPCGKIENLRADLADREICLRITPPIGPQQQTPIVFALCPEKVSTRNSNKNLAPLDRANRRHQTVIM